MVRPWSVASPTSSRSTTHSSPGREGRAEVRAGYPVAAQALDTGAGSSDTLVSRGPGEDLDLARTKGLDVMYQTYDAVLFPANRGRLSRRAPVIRASWFPVVSLQIPRCRRRRCRRRCRRRHRSRQASTPNPPVRRNLLRTAVQRVEADRLRVRVRAGDSRSRAAGQRAAATQRRRRARARGERD